MATVSSPLSSTLSNRREDSNRSPYTPSPRKLKRLQSAYTDELHGESKCKHCGWHYPIQNPDSRQRRHHKKICPKRSSPGSDGESGRSGDYGSPDFRESGGSSVLTVEHEVTHTAESRKRLPFGEIGNKEVREGGVAQKEAERAVDDKLKQTSSTVPTDGGQHGSGTGEEKLEASKDEEFGSQPVPNEGPQEAQSPGSESGSDSGVSSVAGESETDPSDDMAFESSDDNLPSYMFEEGGKQYGASQLQQSHPHSKGASEGSHPEETPTDPEGGGNPVSVANLINKYEKAPTSPLTGTQSSSPSATIGEAGPSSFRSERHKKVGEVTPVEEIQEGQLSPGLEVEYDLELLFKKQRTHDLICPVCGSQINNRIFVTKRRKSGPSKNEGGLPNLKEVTPEASDQEKHTKAITATAGRMGTWVERCFSYLGFFRKDS